MSRRRRGEEDGRGRGAGAEPDSTAGEPSGEAPEGSSGGAPGDVPPAPPLRDFLERSPVRILFEVALGATAAYVLASFLPWGEGREILLATMGGFSAPVALLLTPLSGSVAYRAFRYGMALAVIVTLLLSFALGGNGLPLVQLLSLGLLVFAVGAAGHGLVAVTVDRDPGGEPF